MKLHRKKKGLIRFPYLKYQFIPCQKVIVMNISSRHLFNVVRHRNPLWLAHGMFSEQEKERERREKAGLWSSKVVLVCHVSFFFYAPSKAMAVSRIVFWRSFLFSAIPETG